jgi:hypothetical protein
MHDREHLRLHVRVGGVRQRVRVRLHICLNLHIRLRLRMYMCRAGMCIHTYKHTRVHVEA